MDQKSNEINTESEESEIGGQHKCLQINDENVDQIDTDLNKRPNEESNEDNISDNNDSNSNRIKKKIKKVIKESEIQKSNKRGIVYLSYIPMGLNVQKIRQLLSEFGEIDRIYLEKEKQLNETEKQKKKSQKKSYNCRYAEGWVEFKKKRVAKTVAQVLNGKQIGGKRKNKFYDQIWSIKYLHK